MEKLALSLESKYGGTIGTTSGVTLGYLLTNIVQAGIIISGLITVFLFINAGYQILAAAGNSDPKRHSQGTQTLQYAIIGFVITFGSYWIIRLLEVLLNSNFGTSSLPGF